MFYLIPPTLVNRYEADCDTDVAGLFRAMVGYQWLVYQFCFGLALQRAYFVNIAHDFDALHYSYKAKSYLLLV